MKKGQPKAVPKLIILSIIPNIGKFCLFYVVYKILWSFLILFPDIGKQILHISVIPVFCIKKFIVTTPEGATKAMVK